MLPSESGWACRTELATSSEMITRASSMDSGHAPCSSIQLLSRCRATETDVAAKGRRIVMGA